MRAISIFFLLSTIAHSTFAETIYGATFDYKKALPSTVYFAGKTHEQIVSHCKSNTLGGMDLAACAHFEFEITVDALNRKVLMVEREIEKNDKNLLDEDEPLALPYFKNAQIHWELYRDNFCYAEVYEAGPASLRFIEFWNCMTRITKNRLDEMAKSNADE
ncbi:lysozyme inhibitor LprI family protein [Paraburkholderia caffeinilytica]|uniref:lysozyme inhibitor LprI family protein n=1 Tax=Paraburkholderia caffeinilytica TaxID=1761016 RepID=UPI0038BB0520